MSTTKRIICILLSLALLLTWPGFTPKAEAVAGVDDAVLAVGLLFCTWAGVTFATNQGAATAVGNFLNSSVNGLKACTEVAANYVTNGTLTLVQGVKDAFESILPDINSTFQTQADSLSGSLAGGVSLGASYSCPVSKSFFNHKDGSAAVFPTTIDSFRVDFNDCYVIYTKNSSGSYVSDSGSTLGPNSSDFSYFGFTYALSDSYAHAALYIIGVTPAGEVDTWSYKNSFWGLPNAWVDGITPVVTILSSSDTVDFQRSKEIDGTQALNALTTTDLPDTVYGDDRDRSIEIGAVTGAIAAGLAGSTTQTGLSPDELIEILKKGLLFVEIPETSAPTESTDPTKDPDEDTPIAPLPPDQFNFFGDALQKVNTGLERINESVENFKDGILPQIQLFMDSVAQGFIDVGNWFSDLGEKLLDGLKALGENLSSWLKSLYDVSVEFFTKTFPQWVSDFKTWASSLKQTIIDSIKLALTELFVPSANYWDTKITACKEAFPLFNSIVTTGQGLGGFFSGLGTRPPVIYIDLGNSASWAIGGRTIFLDLTWYSKYKPTMDNVLSAFLWLLFAWRFFLKLPGLLRGEGGTIDRLNSYLEHRDK